MKLGLDTIKELGDKGNDKQAVLDKLFDTKGRQSVLGTYSFDENGDTSLTDYGIYKVGSDGDPSFDHAVKAAT
jgi:branched-chain amino acid transport system substrate-binding protein